MPDGCEGWIAGIGGTLDNDFASGVALTLGDDDTAVVPVGFLFTICGIQNQVVEIDSNGRLFGAGLETSDFSESVSELLNDPTWIIAPLWDDLNPSAGGTVWVNNATSGALTVTWQNVPEFGTSNENSFQVQLFPSGAIEFHYINIDATDGIIGISPGNGAADPGESDYSDLGTGPILTVCDCVIYEQFTGDFDLFNDGLGSFKCPVLINLTDPIINTDFDLSITCNPTATFDFYLIGTALSPPIDLSILGIPCVLFVDSVATVGTVAGSGLSWPTPDLCSLVGTTVRVQGATTGNPPPVLRLTNYLDCTIGTF